MLQGWDLMQQGSARLQSYQGDFHANPIALLENVRHLMMSAIYGRNCSESIATLAPNGSWVKMYQGYCQVKMEDSLEEYLGTWPKWGVMRGGTVTLPTLAELNTTVREYALWQRPIASDGYAWTRICKAEPMRSIWSVWDNGKQDRTTYYHIQAGLNPREAAKINGMMMGFPEDWTS